ncbi:disheveled-associated activator of morphogenesis 1-A [Nematostella vectensis]|uniref:disheveled-associated activator of morphogenesis 1-A n=1 Tax=Nematostella vectensis TaxID=45351 RepID=UPI0013906968|nr:disheveled-associated activator of morphogenesis 1-A [Nematostella vectensis]
MPRKAASFGCFGSRSDHPEIRYGINSGGGVHVLREFSLPMPEENELNSKFAELVEELDLTAVHKKAMFELPPEKKWQLYLSKKKEQAEHSSTSYPEFYIDQLKSLNSQKLCLMKSDEETEMRSTLLDGLKTALRTQPLRFVHRFVELEGLSCLLNFLQNMDYETSQSKIHTAVIGCFKALMNSSHGRAHVLAHPTCIDIIAQSLLTENIKTKIQVLEILGAVCLVPGGHKKALDAMTHFQKFAEERTRFQTLVNDLDRSTGVYKEEFNLKIAIMSFINAALKYGAGAEYLEFRVHLRFEFLMLGIQPVIEKLRTMDNATLTRHLNFFDMVRNEDEKELARRFGMPYIDLRSASGMLELLRRKVGHTSAYPHLLSILHHLLLLPNDHSVARRLWQLIDRVVQQVVLQQDDGGDLDVAPLDINVSYILDTLMHEDEQRREEGIERAEDLKAKLTKKENEIESKKEEMEEMKDALDKMAIKLERQNQELQEAMQRVRQQDEKLGDADSKLEMERQARLRLEEVIKGVGGSIPDDAKISNLSSAMAAANKPSPMAGMPPPPPPPPPPGFPGGAPPPPPPPFGAPPPPALNGGPPPPPGVKVDGAPSSFFGFTKQPNRKTPKPSNPLKSFNWSKLPDSKIKGTVWTDIDDTKVYNEMDLEDFDRMFSAYQGKENQGIKDFTDSAAKPKELSLIDSRRAQNCGILLTKLKLSDEEITKAILTIDEEEELSKDMVEQLLKYVPTAAEKNLLNENNKEKDNFARADKFLYDMSRIVHYEQRLKALFFKKKFPERMGDLKPKVQAVIMACKEVTRSKRIRTLLEVILAFGNYMNRGARGNATGFKLASLNRIVDTKSSANSRITLLNYLVTVLEKSYPDVLKLEEDLANVRTAAKVNLAELESEIVALRKELKEVEKELDFQTRKREKIPGDKFVDVIGSFVKVAQFSCCEVEEAWEELKQKFFKAVKLFGEDPKNLSSDQFFGIFNVFLVSFAEAKHQNEEIKKKKEAEERKRRALAEQKERDRQKSAIKKMMTPDKKQSASQKKVNTDNRGEFDDLISALRTGDVFGDEMSKIKGRRRTAPPKVPRKPDSQERERASPKLGTKVMH